ncbi:MAG: TonB-dependent receptor [Bacteroidota bacterium]|jgi:outer membrane receptor protein involved in Fe transport|nr:TonB-dependent receptor [Ignavibacteria bacterium]MCU7513332.1 TonB-dependent receptor [Ignavibacteria bacterium]MCU7524177.1 TonB-dependent receptor [Ignavibacteria bacterium]
MKKLLLFFSLLLTFSFQTTTFGGALGTTGKIAGRVVDAATREPLPFVNIVVVGTSMGAATDMDGYYSILNLAPGTYSLKASAIGYNSTTVQNVKVSIDLTTKIDFDLSETSVQLNQDVVVVAQRPLVTKDLTASTSVIGATEIQSLPVTEFQEVLQLQAGVVGGNVRGGRSGEVVYAIDGVPVTDVYDGGTVVDVNANSIQEMQFVSGAFNAEYGRALSGYVNIATKDGDNNFTGTLNTYFGDYASTHTNIFRGINKFNPNSIHNYEGSLSGPIIKNVLYFYANARYIYFGGWLNGERRFNPWNITVNNATATDPSQRWVVMGYPTVVNPIDGKTYQAAGDGKLVSMNWNEKMYGQGKLTFKPLPEIKLTYNYIYDHVSYQDFDQAFTFNPDGNYKKFRWGNTNILSLTHTLGANTFYTVNGSYFFKEFRQYVYEDPNDPRYTNSVLLSQQPNDIPTFNTGGTQTQHFKRTTGSTALKFDLTSQITKSHQVKVGAEFNKHRLSFDNVNLLEETGLENPSVSGNPFARYRIPDINNPNENTGIDRYVRNPIEFSSYLQDKIELSELIINVGLRLDYFKPDGKVLTDPTDPDIYRPRNPANLAKTLEERRAYWYKDASSKVQLSPRLGVAFPITDRGVIHFSYGHFFQIPNFDLLYTNPEYKFVATGTGNFGIAGNPDLRPEQTISGEVGLQQALTEDLSVDITGYFRDIRDLAGTRADEIRMFGGAGTYSQYVNSDFGFVKGIIVTLTKRFSNNWSATIDYTLMTAKGNASDPAATRNMITSGQRPEMQILPLAWDQTHTVNATFSYSSPDNWGFSFIGEYGSGFPYTPRRSINVSSLLTNSEMKPATFNVDLRAYKDFILFENYRLSFFARIYNLFDIKNQVGVYDDSGTADFTIDEYNFRLQNKPAIVNTLDEYYNNPTMYSEPRRVEFGASFFF